MRNVRGSVHDVRNTRKKGGVGVFQRLVQRAWLIFANRIDVHLCFSGFDVYGECITFYIRGIADINWSIAVRNFTILSGGVGLLVQIINGNLRGLGSSIGRE